MTAVHHNSAVAQVVQVVFFVFGVLDLLLLLRVLLHGAGVNPENPIASGIFYLSQPFVNVFVPLFLNPQIGPNAVLELTTLVAVIIYSVLGWMIGRVIWLTLSKPR